jgi:hypothetical protein
MTDFTAASAGGEPHRGGIRSSQGSHGFWQYPRALNDEPSGTGVGRAFYGGLGDLRATAAIVSTRPVIGEVTMADSATIPTHLDTPGISTYMSSNALGRRALRRR